MNIASVGIDLGKMTFHLVALDDHGKVIIRRKFSRNHLLAYTANPRWSLQNRPRVDVSKPATLSGLRQVLFYPAEVVRGKAGFDFAVTC